MAAAAWDRFSRIAAAAGTRPALIQGDSQTSFSQLRSDALAWAVVFDVGPGERVAVSGANGPAMAAAILGTWARGGVPVLVHAEAPAHHLAHAVATTGAAVVVTDRTDAPALDAPMLPLVTPGTAPEAEFALRGSAAEPASILFTSGSTGRPKGVVQSAANLIDGAARVAALMGYRADDRILCPIPFAFDYGWGQLLSTFFRGVPLVLPEPANAFGLCEALERHAPTVLAGVPAVFSDLLAGLAPVRETPRASVRLISNTGSRIPAPVFASLVEVFPDAAVSLNYGLTETYRSAALPPALARAMPDCVGLPVAGVDLVVLREDGSRAATEEEGEIVHRGAGVCLGYWGDVEATERVMRPDPLWPYSGVPAPRAAFTGDLGRLDAAGRLYVHGRRDRQMKVMGVRVSPDEIETLLMASAEISAAAVASAPHDMLGEKIVAAVVLTPGADPNEALKALKRHARATMSAYMQPRDWRVVDALPRTPSGKTDYPRLKRLAEAPA